MLVVEIVLRLNNQRENLVAIRTIAMAISGRREEGAIRNESSSDIQIDVDVVLDKHNHDNFKIVQHANVIHISIAIQRLQKCDKRNFTFCG